MLKYFISLLFCLSLVNSFSQKKQENKTIKKDSIVYKTGYGLRIGADISKPALAIFDKSYSGLELVGDYRISKKWYIATEIGYEDETTYEDFTTSSANGSYIRLGSNYNAYNNWLDMNNEIYIGARYGFALFSHELKNYTLNTGSPYFPSKTIKNTLKDTDLQAHWIEFQVGIKAETLKNLFFGISASYKIGISIDQQKGFETLYTPGFNRVYDSNTGFGFNYTISYLIPFIKK